MAVPTTVCAIRYGGNNSTETPYTIPFPFESTAHIYAALSEAVDLATVDGSEAAGSDFTDWEITLEVGAPTPAIGDRVEDEDANRGIITNVQEITEGSVYQIRISNDDPFAPDVSDAITLIQNTLLDGGDYTVTRLADGSGGSLVTTEAVSDIDRLLIFRATPLTQPTEFENAGPFPAESAETAYDRLLMQVQELNRIVRQLHGLDDEAFISVPTGDPDASRDVATWADEDARGAVKPRWAGQLGVERDTQTVWIAQSTDTGDWEEFRPRYRNQLVIGLVADAGDPGDEQDAVATMLSTWAPDAVIFAGDNNYNGAAQYDADWNAFNFWVSLGTAYPALGNHDIDSAGYEALHNAKFSYLPTTSGSRRYYNKVLGGGLVELFVINSGLDSLGDLIEPDGNTVGSDQHTWFVAALAASRARWRIAVFHHPPISTNGTAGKVATELAWPELKKCDLVCCGHAHLAEILQWGETMIANISGAVRSDGDAEGLIQGSVTEIDDRVLWAEDEKAAVARIVATEERLSIEVWRPTFNQCLHARDCRDISDNTGFRERFRLFEPGAAAIETADMWVSTIPVPTLIKQVMLATDVQGSFDLDWELHAGAVLVASGTFLTSETFMSVESSVPTSMIPTGTRLTWTMNAYPEAVDLEGLDLFIVGTRYANP